MERIQRLNRRQFGNALTEYLVEIAIQNQCTVFTVGNDTVITLGPDGTHSCFIENQDTIRNVDQSQETISDKMKSIVNQIFTYLTRRHGECKGSRCVSHIIVC